MQRSTPNNYISESLLCLALMVGGTWFGAYHMTAGRGKPMAPVGVLTGAAVACVGYERSRRCNLGIQHYSEGLNNLFDDLDQMIWGWMQQSKPMVKRVIPIAYLPPKFQSFAAAQLERMVDEDWVSGFLKRSKLVCGVTRSGKCLGKGTPVLMYDGSIKPVEDIKVGDLLMGDDSSPRTVMSLARGREEMFKVIPNKGEPWTCNKSHIMCLVFNRKDGKGKYTQDQVYEMSVDEYLSMPAQSLQKNFLLYRTGVDFPHQEVPLDPYFLGVWLGDGDSAGCRITTPDPEIIEYLEEYATVLGLQVGKTEHKNSKANGYQISLPSKHGGRGKLNPVKKHLRDLNLLSNKHIPDIYLKNSYEVRMQLLAGLIDTDGCHNNAGMYEYVSVRPELAEGVVFLARSLGFWASSRIKMVNGKSYHRVHICGDLGRVPVKIARRKITPSNKHDSLRTGFKVESLGEGDYYGFVLDGNSRFLLGDFTVTHNTTWFLHEVANFFERYPDGCLTICDLNYGKPDEDGNINTWLDLPRDRFIRVHYEKIYDSIKGEWEEMERRKKIAIANASGPKKPLHFQRRKLLIDEVIAVINEAKRRDKQKPSGEPKELPYLQGWIGDLLYQGLGYQMECTFGLQSMAVGENGLNLAMQEQLNVLLLGATAVNTQNVARLPGIRDAAALIDKLKTIREMPGCKFAAIAKIDSDEPCIKIIPRIDVTQIELQLPTNPFSPEDAWWATVATDEFYEWMKEQAIAYASGGKSPLKAICKKLGIEPRTSDPKYRVFKEHWDELLNEVKETL